MNSISLNETLEELTVAPQHNVNGSARKPEAPAATVAERLNLTDLGNSRRLLRQHGEDLRYCAPLGGWLVWDGRRWACDENGEIYRRARDVPPSILREAEVALGYEERLQSDLHTAMGGFTSLAAAEEDLRVKALRGALTRATAWREKLEKWAIASESAPRIKAMVELAQSDAAVVASPDDFDRDPWLLNCENSTLDLRTGELHPHRRADLCMKLAGAPYEPAAQTPRFQQFLAEIMDGNAELIAFIQRFFGYSLTGDASEEVLALLYGTGRNGKTKLLEVIRAVLGDYGQSTPFETLLASERDPIRNDLARLRSARYVSATEPNDQRRLDEAVIKQVTGGDTISVRFLHKEFFELRPVFKLWLAANHKPVIRGTDEGIWSRIRLIPFTVRIANPDTKLLSKLQAELPGILAWAVEGCLAWQRDGLGEPAEVRNATEQYRDEMDVIGAFIAECCTIHPRAQVTAGDLYRTYASWCEQNGERVLKQREFGARLTERGFERQQLGHAKAWHRLGIGLLSHLAEPDSTPERSTKCGSADLCVPHFPETPIRKSENRIGEISANQGTRTPARSADTADEAVFE